MTFSSFRPRLTSMLILRFLLTGEIGNTRIHLTTLGKTLQTTVAGRLYALKKRKEKKWAEGKTTSKQIASLALKLTCHTDVTHFHDFVVISVPRP